MSKQAVAHHKNAAEHLQNAARHYHEAGKHYAGGRHEKAAHYAYLAQGHIHHALDYASKAAKSYTKQHGKK